MRWQENPVYKGPMQPIRSATGRWAWRVVFLAGLAVSILRDGYLAAGTFALIWIAVEVWQARRLRQDFHEP